MAPQREEHPNLNADDPLWDLMHRCWRVRPGDRPDIYEVEADVREARDARSEKPQLPPIGAPRITLDEDHLRRQLASVAMTSASRAFPEALELTRPRDNLLAADPDHTPGRDMETSRSELGSGVKSDQVLSLPLALQRYLTSSLQQPVFSVDSTAVDPTQALRASEAEPPSNNRHLPTVRMEDSAARGVVSSQEGASLRAKSQAGSLDPNVMEEDSLVQPGRHVPERNLPSELSGALTKIRELDGSLTKKTGDKIDGGTYADVSEGVLDQPDGSRIKVAIKSIRRFAGTEEKRFNMLCDAARGLAHLHSSDPVITHGDIEPNNVIVMDNLDGALCDFGVSRLFVGVGIPSGLTTTGNRSGGMAGYMSKERLEGTDPPASVPADVYAFGGLILATMSGKNPFWNRKNDAARIVAVWMGQTPHPKDHPKLPSTDPLLRARGIGEQLSGTNHYITILWQANASTIPLPPPKLAGGAPS
ncbi:hypothetical protein FRC00_007191 [Tulasnella sp. 408]|nr:hypothetical protein FRC00_007191 [Tulasnella sp. 408]